MLITQRHMWFFVLITIVLYAGCAPEMDPPAETNSQSGDSDTHYTIGMSQCNLGEPWRVQMNADIQRAADAHPEIEMIFKDAQNDSLRQRSHVEELMEQKVDLIIISPREAQPLTDPVARAVDAGIPVIVLDRAVLGDRYTCFIGADNVLIGRLAGQWLVEHLGGKGKVVELKGLMTSVPGQDRHNGFRSAIEGTQIEVVFEADMKWLESDARREMDSALARFDNIDAVYAHNDPGAHGAWLAARAAGRTDNMAFVGIDALPHEGVAYVHQEMLDATFAYPTGGAEAIDVALKILQGEPVEKKIVLGSRKFTRDTLPDGEAVE